jgi:hypothetical protein
MSKEARSVNSTIASITARSSDLVEQYTVQLDTFTNEIVPVFLDNAEYAARTSALMIALNRQLARCAVAFGETHQIAPEAMIELVTAQFVKNMAICASAVEGEGAVLQ